MSRSRIKRAAGPATAAGAALALGLTLAACSDNYIDRRDLIAQSGGDAIAANKVEQMVDPWPYGSENRNLAFNGQKMQSAVQRYRTGKVFPPANIYTSDAVKGHEEPANAGLMTGNDSGSGASGAGAPPTQ